MVTALAMSLNLRCLETGAGPSGGAFPRHRSLDRPKVKFFAGENPRDSCRLPLKKTVFRPRQAEIFSQRPALILSAEDSALLQFRHHLVDEVVEALRPIGEHDIKPTAPKTGEPSLHLIGDSFWRADEEKPAIAADALGELAHGELVPRCQVNAPLTAALGGIGFGDWG